MTDKERLERVEAMLHWADKYQEAGNGRLVDRTTNQIYQEFHIDWLIHQARRVQELEEENKRYKQAMQNAINACRYTNPEVAYILREVLEGDTDV